ncbi:hypothetical protein Phum_PHUM358590 [Pediculus humanus corporis]|uniref:Uncharacterized protein n=1 Tax=Pediculus humanus subsp. corporis TaxID=121224 RepID=E0VPF1_PEDHC|nr:uncharacterized protein Phum_PHUM358590 [Pediculus humanus corporis]EEB15257.1 hypothetical protein Phum_PHUM358590 [Pediculus humanus corporis]
MGRCLTLFVVTLFVCSQVMFIEGKTVTRTSNRCGPGNTKVPKNTPLRRPGGNPNMPGPYIPGTNRNSHRNFLYYY